eukprot:jgi/Mesen1/9140/ME000058S08632
MTTPAAVPGNMTPIAGVQESATLPKLGAPEVLGLNFDFPDPEAKAVSGEDEKLVADMNTDSGSLFGGAGLSESDALPQDQPQAMDS